MVGLVVVGTYEGDGVMGELLGDKMDVVVGDEVGDIEGNVVGPMVGVTQISSSQRLGQTPFTLSCPSQPLHGAHRCCFVQNSVIELQWRCLRHSGGSSLVVVTSVVVVIIGLMVGEGDGAGVGIRVLQHVLAHTTANIELLLQSVARSQPSTMSLPQLYCDLTGYCVGAAVGA